MNIDVVVYISLDNTAQFHLLHSFECHYIFLTLVVDKGLSFWVESIVIRNYQAAKNQRQVQKNIMAFEDMKQIKMCGVIEMYTTMWILITSMYLMGIGITTPVESKWTFLLCSSYETVHVEIGFSLFDSYAVVNPFIAWRNFKLKARQSRSVYIWTTGSDKHALTSWPHPKMDKALQSTL